MGINCHSIQRHTNPTFLTISANAYELYQHRQEKDDLKIHLKNSTPLKKSNLQHTLRGTDTIEMVSAVISLLNQNEINRTNTENLYQILFFPYLYDFTPTDEKTNPNTLPLNNMLNSFQLKFFSIMNERINELFNLNRLEEKQNKYRAICSLLSSKENNYLTLNTTQGSTSSDQKSLSSHKKLTHRATVKTYSDDMLFQGILSAKSAKHLKFHDSFLRGPLNKINETTSSEKEGNEIVSFYKNKKLKENFPQIIKEEISRTNEARKENNDNIPQVNGKSRNKKVMKKFQDKKQIYSAFLRKRNMTLSQTRNRTSFSGGHQMISHTYSCKADRSKRKILCSEGVVLFENNIQLNWEPFLMKHEKSVLNYLRENLSPSSEDAKVHGHFKQKTPKKKDNIKFMNNIKKYHTTETKENLKNQSPDNVEIKPIQVSSREKKVKIISFSGTFVEYVDKYLERDISYRMKKKHNFDYRLSDPQLSQSHPGYSAKNKISHKQDLPKIKPCNTAPSLVASQDNIKTNQEESPKAFTMSDSEVLDTETLLDEKSIEPKPEKKAVVLPIVRQVTKKLPYERAFTFKDYIISTMNTENERQTNS